MSDSTNKSKKINYFKLSAEIIIFVLIGIAIGFGLKKGDDILGLIGGLIGVMGAFLLYNFQSNKEKKEESDLNFNIIKNLLIYTVSETDKMLDFMIKIYIKLYIDNPKNADKTSIGFKILKNNVEGKSNNPIMLITYKYNRGTFEGMIESLGLSDVIHKFEDSSADLNSLEKITFQMIQSDYSTTREDLIREFRTIEDKEYMIYDKNWCSYIHNINDLKFGEIDMIIKWLNIINKPIDKSDEKRKEIVLELEKLNQRKIILDAMRSDKYNGSINKEKHTLELHEVSRQIYLRNVELERLKKEVIYHICDFIHYRDKVIAMLKSEFKYDKFKTSTDKIKEEVLNL